MNILAKLNLNPGYIYETIVTTYNPQDKMPNAAPMGIAFHDEKTVVISPYMTTQTFKNIQQTRYAVINFIYDLDTFFESAFGTNKPKLPLHRFKPSKKVPVPGLKDAFAYVEVETLEIQKDASRAKIIAEIKTWDVGQIPCFPINRGYNLVLESIIHATRIVEFRDDEKLVGPLITLIKQYSTLVTKVAPEGKLVALMAQLENLIEKKEN